MATGSSVLVVPRRRVLVVEDSDDARDALRALLEIDGHEVSVAGTGEAALEAVGRATPDIALIDIGLPDFDGYELARRLRRLCRGGKTRLVAVTGYGQEEDRRRALAAGFDTHIVKPVDPERLARLLHQFTEVGEI